MDVRGNFRWWEHYFPIQATDILRKSTNRVGAVDVARQCPRDIAENLRDQQRGFLNKRLANPFVVAVRDADNEPVAGVQVTFSGNCGWGKPFCRKSLD